MIQSNYIPWRGYFDFIDDVDLFVFYDDVAIGQGKKWRNRNAIKTRYGTQWLTVPLRHHHKNTPICEVTIDYSRSWQSAHLNLLRENYICAPYWTLYIDTFAQLIGEKYGSISALNRTLCAWIMRCLGICTRVATSDSYAAKGSKTERPLALLRELGATAYLSGPTAESYTPTHSFAAAGIELAFKSYDYLEYPQPWGAFDGRVSVLDLLFNTGPAARMYLKSSTPNRRAAHGTSR